MFNLKCWEGEAEGTYQNPRPPPARPILPGPVKYILIIIKLKLIICHGKKLAWLPGWRNPTNALHFSHSGKAPGSAIGHTIKLRSLL